MPFYNWQLHPDDYLKFGFWSQGRQCYGHYTYLPMGFGPAPGVNDQSLLTIVQVKIHFVIVRALSTEFASTAAAITALDGVVSAWRLALLRRVNSAANLAKHPQFLQSFPNPICRSNVLPE